MIHQIKRSDNDMTYYDAGQYDIAVIGAGYLGPIADAALLRRKFAAALEAEIAQAEFTSAEH